MGVIILEDLIFYRSILDNIRNNIKYLSDNKQRETILSFLDKKYNENTINDYLAYVLDPNKNGIGNKPLNNLISNFNSEIDIEYIDDTIIEVNREYTFDDGTRIDILININNELVIGMENKVNSKERKDQTFNYKEQIEKEFGENHILIFLTIGGQKPNSDFNSLSYKELVENLKNVNYDFTENIRKSIYYQDLIIHLEEYIMNEEYVSISEKTKLYIKNKSLIQDLKDSLENDSKNSFDKIENYIENYFDDNLEVDFGGRSYQQFYKETWKSFENLNVHFEYHFSPEDLLLRNKINFMIDVEKSNKEKFIDIFNTVHKDKIKNFENKNIYNCPDKRERAVAYKEYDFEPEKLISIIDKSLSEFEFLIDLIDKTFEIYSERNFSDDD